jgi:hypothetical protein
MHLGREQSNRRDAMAAEKRVREMVLKAITIQWLVSM